MTWSANGELLKVLYSVVEFKERNGIFYPGRQLIMVAETLLGQDANREHELDLLGPTDAIRCPANTN
jgi:hypothetical protein